MNVCLLVVVREASESRVVYEMMGGLATRVCCVHIITLAGSCWDATTWPVHLCMPQT
jgi:hypothetical protein